MKQLGNLAVICARRRDALLQVSNGRATLFVGTGPDRGAITAEWDDDARIEKMIYELNYGRFAERKETRICNTQLKKYAS
jgi:alkanesulfonate monooxygenase SsuD/methylene tetrahydromethanopterin reductase-like flavin-dependent oxidoreductase (luciferase family)